MKRIVRNVAGRGRRRLVTRAPIEGFTPLPVMIRPERRIDRHAVYRRRRLLGHRPRLTALPFRRPRAIGRPGPLHGPSSPFGGQANTEPALGAVLGTPTSRVCGS